MRARQHENQLYPKDAEIRFYNHLDTVYFIYIFIFVFVFISVSIYRTRLAECLR